MIKVVQFGEGNFLRAFADLYFDTLNKEGLGEYKVNILKPAPFGDLTKFEKANSKYNVVLRGTRNGKAVEEVYKVDCVESTSSPFTDYEKFLALSEDKELRIIVSNTTEAGIQFCEKDEMNGFENITYPAKLTKFLYNRYLHKLDGVYLMPVELIENNADELYKCVDKYISLWNLGEDFRKWNDTENFYCNTLVDRIVSGHPRDEQTQNHLDELIGYRDELSTIGEPFGLWVVQNKGDIKKYIKEGHHNIDVILTDDISYYKRRKVRVLNGSHTNLVPISLWNGMITVYDTMVNDKLAAFVQKTLDEEIIPFVSDDIAATKSFADEVHDRFMNPFLNHQLTSIALNSISKWKARVLPSFSDFYAKNNAIPRYFTIGLAYLIALYQRIYKKDNCYFVDLPSRTIEVKDDVPYLEFFKDKNVHDFLADKSIWGMDLTSFRSLEETINKHLEVIKKGGSLI